MRFRSAKSYAAAVVSAGLVVGLATAAAADVVNPDGDTAAPGDSPAAFSTAAGNCASTIAGAITLDFNGNSHFAPGEAVTVAFAAPSGYGIVPSAGAFNIPSGWGTSVTEVSIPISTQISPTTPDSTGGPYQVGVSVTGDVSGYSPSGKPQYSVSVSCGAAAPSNTVPTVAFVQPATEVNEGATVTFTFSITDPDAGDSHSYAAGYPSCGSGNTVSNASIDDVAGTGSFQCTFPDGLVPAVSSSVTVKVNDGHADSNEAATAVQVDNVNPAVAAPSFAAASVDCRSGVSLNGISFSDPGVNDDDWTVDIDWGDGTAHTSYTTATQGSQPSASHVYVAPGTYSATVTVTDKDTGAGANTSSNAIVVNQVYNSDFLPPFDDSSPSGLIVNTMKNGRVVPVKVTLYDVCAQGYVTSGNVTVKVTKTSGTSGVTADPVESYADAGSSSGGTSAFRWTSDSTVAGGGFWIYNLDSKALGLITNNFYRVDVYVGTAKATVANWGVLQPVK